MKFIGIIQYRIPFFHSTKYIVTVQHHTSIKTFYSTDHRNNIAVHISRNFLHTNCNSLQSRPLSTQLQFEKQNHTGATSCIFQNNTMLQACISKGGGSNLCRVTSYPESDNFILCSQKHKEAV